MQKRHIKTYKKHVKKHVKKHAKHTKKHILALCNNLSIGLD